MEDQFARASHEDAQRQQQIAARGEALAAAMVEKEKEKARVAAAAAEKKKEALKKITETHNSEYAAKAAAAAAAVGGAKEKFGYRVGDVVFYTRGGRTFESGNVLVYGCEGEVTDVGGRNKLIGVTFPGNKEEVGCHISAISHTAAPAAFARGGFGDGATAARREAVAARRRSHEADSAREAVPAPAVVVGGVQNGPVPSRGLTTAGAPPTTTSKSPKRPARTSGSMAPELLEKYQQWPLLIPGRKHVGELQFPYPENGSFCAYVNIDKVMDTDAFYTDSTSCAMDSFNLGIGRPALSRQIINSPFDPDKGISYEQMAPAIQASGFAMVAVVSGSKKKRIHPTMTQILGLVSGVFFVEFHWRNKDGDRDFHVAAANCDQRRVFCSTLGVIPFAAGKKNESAATHAQVVADLKVVNVYRAYRIVQCKI
jgi:hypothetical protein